METEQIFISDLTDDFVSVTAGDPFRLFRYGNIYRGGKEHTISKDVPIKLPHFRAPIKLGSHKDETPAGGFITGLEYRDDGVYALPEWNDEGLTALEKGSYRYHSPEMLWEGWSIENSQTGEITEGPMVVGVALLHTPALGETTALYTYKQEQKMSEQVETVAVPKDFWDKFTGFFTFKKEDEPEPEEEDNRDEFEAVIVERDELKERVDAFEAEKKQAELYTAIRKEFAVDEFGAGFQAIADEEGAIEMLAQMGEEARKWVVEKFAALSAQKDLAEKEIGEDAALPGGVEGFEAAIAAYQKEHEGVNYADATMAVANEQPELYAAYKGAK